MLVQVITKQVDGHKYEPFEEAVIEVPEEHVGPVVDMLGQRKGQMLDLVAGSDTTSLTRCLLCCHRCLLVHGPLGYFAPVLCGHSEDSQGTTASMHNGS